MKAILIHEEKVPHMDSKKKEKKMEPNPYEYNSYNQPVAWIPQQNQPEPPYEGRYVRQYTRPQQPPNVQNQRPQAAGKEQKPKAPERMSKARALTLVRKFKKVLVVASLVGFGSFSGLAAYHQAITTTSQASNNTHTKSATGSSSTSSSSNSNSSSSSSNTGSNFGSSNSSSSSVSGTSVS